jgi:AraC-like DNA-binding protein
MLGELCSRLTDERLLIGSAPIVAEVRSRVYSLVTSLWEIISSGRDSGEQSRLVRRAAAMLRDSADAAADRDENIEDVARRLGYGKSRLYSLFTHEVGMAPNDYRQRLRIKRCCERLTKTSDSITAIGIENGFQSSQYFSRVFKKYVGLTPTDYRTLFRPH